MPFAPVPQDPLVPDALLEGARGDEQLSEHLLAPVMKRLYEMVERVAQAMCP